MTDDDAPAPSDPTRRRRRPATIDLTATEVAPSETAETTPPEHAAAEAAQDAPEHADAASSDSHAAESVATESVSAEPQGATDAAASPASGDATPASDDAPAAVDAHSVDAPPPAEHAAEESEHRSDASHDTTALATPESMTPDAGIEPVAASPPTADPAHADHAAQEHAAPADAAAANAAMAQASDVAEQAAASDAQDKSAASDTPAQAAAAASDPTPAAKPEKRRGGFLPALGAGLVGGVMTAAALAALWLGGLVKHGNENADLDIRLGLIEARLSTLGPSSAGPSSGGPGSASGGPASASGGPPPGLEALTARIDKLEAAAETPRANAVPDIGVASRVDTVEAALKTISDSIINLDKRLQTMTNDQRVIRERADAASAAAAEAARATPIDAATRTDLAAVSGKVTTLETTAKSLSDELARRAAAPPPSDKAARIAVLAAALRGAAERGDPFVGDLAALKSLLPDAAVLTPLEPFAPVGVPSAVVLSREASAIADAMLRENRVASADSSFLTKLQANAERLVRIRPVEAAGDDTLSVIARAESRAAQNDVPGTLAEFAKLPDDKRAPAESWMKRAQARIAAIGAARKVTADSAAALAGAP